MSRQKKLGKKNICDVKDMTFDQFDIKTFFSKLEKYIQKSTRVLVAVSGGVDSMVVATLVFRCFLENRIPLEQLYFLHLNHGVRSESEEEQNFVQTFFDEGGMMNDEGLWNELVVKERNPLSPPSKGGCPEAGLRQWRYEQFAEVCEEKKIDFLVTGHHLNDRVESTFLHLLRGAGVDGFLSMRYCETHHLLGTTKILRPLLGFRKKQIESIAIQNKIPFVVDESNFDDKTSKRNLLRNQILPELFALGNGDEKFLESFGKVYDQIDPPLFPPLRGDVLKLVEMELVDEWDAEWGYQLKIKNEELRIKSFLCLLKDLGVAQNVTQKNMSEIVDFLNTKESGYKYLNGVNFLVSHGDVYVVKAEREFRKVQNTECKIQGDGVFPDGEWRYPQAGDRFHGKTWKQFCICQKIPVFWRDWVPVCVEEEQIVCYFWDGKVRR